MPKGGRGGKSNNTVFVAPRFEARPRTASFERTPLLASRSNRRRSAWWRSVWHVSRGPPMTTLEHVTSDTPKPTDRETQLSNGTADRQRSHNKLAEPLATSSWTHVHRRSNCRRCAASLDADLICQARVSLHASSKLAHSSSGRSHFKICRSLQAAEAHQLKLAKGRYERRPRHESFEQAMVQIPAHALCIYD